MRMTLIFKECGEPFQYYPQLTADLGINVNAGVLLCLIGWRSFENKIHVWYEASQAKIQNETGLSFREQKTARKTLVKKNLIEERYDRLSHKFFVRLVVKKDEQEQDEADNETRFRESQEQASRESAKRNQPDNETRFRLLKEQEEQKKLSKTKAKTRLESFLDRWASERLQYTGERAKRPTALAEVVTLLESGFTNDEIMEVARKAWKATKAPKAFYANLSVSLISFCKHYEAIRNEVQEKTQQKSIAHTGGNY